MKAENRAVVKVLVILTIVVAIVALVAWISYPYIKALIIKKIMKQVVTPKGIVTGVFRKII